MERKRPEAKDAQGRRSSRESDALQLASSKLKAQGLTAKAATKRGRRLFREHALLPHTDLAIGYERLACCASGILLAIRLKVMKNMIGVAASYGPRHEWPS